MNLKKIAFTLFLLCILSIALPICCMEQNSLNKNESISGDILVEKAIKIGLANHAFVQSLFDKNKKSFLTILILPNETLFHILTLAIHDIFNLKINSNAAIKDSLKFIARIKQVNKRFSKFYKDLLRYQKSWLARKFAEETLFDACKTNNQELIVTLFTPNLLEAFKENPLFEDCIGLDAVLLNDGLNIDARGSKGYTALMLAVNQNNEDLVKFLSNFTINKSDNSILTIQANLDAANTKGLTPLMIASSMANTNIITFLLESNVNIHAKDICGRNALMYAAESRNWAEILPIFLQYGAHINDIDENGNTALMHASEYGRIKSAQDLLAANAKVNTKNKGGNTALSIASYYGHEEYIKILLENDANSNTKNNDGDTPLLRAAKWGKKNVIVILLNADANVNARNFKGDSALIIATRGKYADIVQLLLEHKADTSIKNNDNLTAEEIAIKNNDIQIIELFTNSSE